MIKRCEWLVRIALAFCVVYGLIAIQNHGHEVFPFFTWDLFSSVPNHQQVDYSARLVSADSFHGKLPVYFEVAGLQPAGQTIQGYSTLQTIGRLLAAGDRQGANTARRRFEAGYLASIKNVRYEIVRRSFDIRKRVDCNTCYSGVRVLASYDSG